MYIDYLKTDSPTTKIKGAQAVAELNGEIWGIDCKMAVIKK
jgi:hypothetical protein